VKGRAGLVFDYGLAVWLDWVTHGCLAPGTGC